MLNQPRPKPPCTKGMGKEILIARRCILSMYLDRYAGRKWWNMGHAYPVIARMQVL